VNGVRDGYVLVLRACNADMTSRNGFKWPESGHVKVDNWDPTPGCGPGGLYGWLWGEGDASSHSEAVDPWAADAKWLLVEVLESSLVDCDRKVKFPEGDVVFCGSRLEATTWLVERAPGKATIGATLTGGARSTLTGGYASTLTGGARSTLTGGYASTLTGGYASTLTGGARSTLTGGAKAELRIRYWDPKNDRWRTAIAYVGEDIEADTAYVLNDERKFVKKG
jgi:hypothetical protein